MMCNSGWSQFQFNDSCYYTFRVHFPYIVEFSYEDRRVFRYIKVTFKKKILVVHFSSIYFKNLFLKSLYLREKTLITHLLWQKSALLSYIFHALAIAQIIMPYSIYSVLYHWVYGNSKNCKPLLFLLICNIAMLCTSHFTSILSLLLKLKTGVRQRRNGFCSHVNKSSENLLVLSFI